MIKNLMFIYTLVYSLGCVYAQVNKNVDVTINGITSVNIIDNDTIMFRNVFVDSKYFEKSTFLAEIKNSKFNFGTRLSYPHLFGLSFKSEKDSILFRGGNYFIDKSTNFIKIDHLDGCNIINGETSNEYINKFIPFFITDDAKCKEEKFLSYVFFEKEAFNKKLNTYIKNNPDSYVGLWFLIRRVNAEGYSQLYEDILNSFSNKIKHGELWNILNDDMKSIRIRENKKFPNLVLKNRQLSTEKLKIPEAKYTLIDYWFNRCIPCLKSFPKLKELYANYKSKGFEIISISVDRTKEISNWNKKIDDNELNWSHYLDENGTESKTDKIFNFPTTFLLDKDGIVIMKNIKPEDLENLLKKELN